MITSYPFTGYLAPEGFLEPLLQELGDAVDHVHGRLVFCPGPPVLPPGHRIYGETR